MLISIDPGVHHCGVALWEDGELVYAWLAGSKKAKKGSTWRDTVRAVELGVLEVVPQLDYVTELAIEKPNANHRNKKGDPQNIVNLAFVAGAVSAAFADSLESSVEYLPSDWKKTVPKPVMKKRIEKRLRGDEPSRIAKRATHDVFDAIGIGLKYLRRL